MITFRQRLHQDEQGVSLIELLVVVVLMGILGGIVLTSAIAIQRATTRTEQTNLTLGEARIASANLERRLRTAIRATGGAPTVTAVSDRSVRFLSLVEGQTAPDQIEIAIDSGEVVERRWTADDDTVPPGTWTYSGTPVQRQLLANIDDASTLFQFHDVSTCPTEDESGSRPGSDEVDFDACVPLDPATLALISVDMIEVTLDAERQDGQGPPIELHTRIFLRNTIYSTS